MLVFIDESGDAGFRVGQGIRPLPKIGEGASPCVTISLRTKPCEIDENLVRAELTDSQRARAHARREQIMVSLGLVRERGGDRRSNEQNVHLKSYSADASQSLGVHEKTVRLDLARGKKIDPEVLAEVSGTPQDKGVVLDALAATRSANERVKTPSNR
ncbi:MAG TPA: hypothetical protein VHY32_09345 [Caulobacteraceae bacterium]|jgi:hypothetical protein|nr:hypothetical protein [Caulobacteraceae bacterium]